MRYAKPYLLILLAAFSIPVVSNGQSACSNIADAEKKTYGFRPGKLSDSERKEKSEAMDSYWNLVKSSGSEGVACLRSLLPRQADGFAVFDEGSLLYSLDHSAESTDVVVHAVARTDLTDVQPADYVGMALQLAHEGADIEPIANNYLTAKNDVTTYLARHGGYKLGRAAGALLLYGIMPTDKIDDTMSRAVHSEVAEVRNAAVVVWSLNMTERSFKGLAALGNLDGFSEEAKHQVRFVLTPFEVRVTTPKYTREQMLAKIGKFPEIEMDKSEDFAREDKALDNSVYATFTNADVETLRESRRKFITGVSNESVEGYTEMSRVLIHLINKLHMYAEYRTFGQ
jgi:hypothetical protein